MLIRANGIPHNLGYVCGEKIVNEIKSYLKENEGFLNGYWCFDDMVAKFPKTVTVMADSHNDGYVFTKDEDGHSYTWTSNDDMYRRITVIFDFHEDFSIDSSDWTSSASINTHKLLRLAGLKYENDDLPETNRCLVDVFEDLDTLVSNGSVYPDKVRMANVPLTKGAAKDWNYNLEYNASRDFTCAKDVPNDTPPWNNFPEHAIMMGIIIPMRVPALANNRYIKVWNRVVKECGFVYDPHPAKHQQKMMIMFPEDHYNTIYRIDRVNPISTHLSFDICTKSIYILMNGSNSKEYLTDHNIGVGLSTTGMIKVNVEFKEFNSNIFDINFWDGSNENWFNRIRELRNIGFMKEFMEYISGYAKKYMPTVLEQFSIDHWKFI